jgi:hypothetical protein
MNWNSVDELEMIEQYAESEGWVSSEQQLSDYFDEEVAPYVVEQYGSDEQCAIDQAFNDWSDGLCKDGMIHEKQYNEYCYVGKYSD